ncbi:coiled-coil domain-containing glutamate-rich protein 1 [Toxotes jaculatrix]|uniref:coiled-coil domain-containing glutamate-rich protein 1 n=1 Tax=Toxotes jaculatrix TaxID=941984 RepID=UPI001B3AFE13|nr:coiled-coil domain-containing glutamate-rich protein 1 [Toxotes jaculatrix]XP_040890792.1 coiled-coil domain-containing glutamate-rich protein 1 [Toxotes jaculatrix]
MLSEMMCRRSCHQQQDGKEAPQRDAASRRKHGWSKSCRGRLQGRRTGGWPKGRNHHHQHPQRHHPHQHHPRHLQRMVMSLRPVNVKGNRARGMRAPKNTNQFLMHEKYQMLHMRSDSVGSDSGSSSDSDMELTDMDSYLGVLENARGALLDSPNPHGSTTPPGQILVLHEDSLHLHGDSLRLHEDSLRLQEDSMQYFPSEDDLMQSQNFMQRDFVEFCDILTS